MALRAMLYDATTTPSYYFDVLPIHPSPEPLESFTGYLTRLAEANGVQSAKSWITYLFQGRRQAIRKDATDYPPVSFSQLPVASTYSENMLLSTTFYHLGRKFNRSTLPQHLGRFLRGTVADTLRYCPACLRESGYYRLDWRFLFLNGCSIHKCKLLEHCGHCNSLIPLLATPLQITSCPTCQGDLSVCTTNNLSQSKLVQTTIDQNDLEFLLCPHPLEMFAGTLIRFIGAEFVSRRRERGLSRRDVTNHLQVTPNQVNGIECGDIHYRGGSFASYVKYASFLGVPFASIYASASRAMQNVELQIKESRAAYSSEEISERETLLMAQVCSAADTLALRGVVVTQQAISDEMKMSLSGLQYYSSVRQLLRSVVIQYSKFSMMPEYVGREHELLERVKAVVTHLVAQKSEITDSAVARLLGMTRSGLS